MGADAFLRDRRTYILHLLETQGRVETKRVCELFGLAPSSARRLLDGMSREGLLLRTYGGAVSADAERDEPLSRKSRLNTEQKRAIARAARAHIRDGDVIALAGGTTVLELARLCMDLKGSIVLTDSIPAANVLMHNPDIELRICSGIVRGRTGCVIGPTAGALFGDIRSDAAFLGADGVRLDRGVCSSNFLVGGVEGRMAASADRVYILCDCSKLGASSVMPFLPFSGVCELITDAHADPVFLDGLSQRGVTVTRAS